MANLSPVVCLPSELPDRVTYPSCGVNPCQHLLACRFSPRANRSYPSFPFDVPTGLPYNMGAFSDDEVSRDSQSLSSRGSSGRNREGNYEVFTPLMCGAIFTTAQTGERAYVCLRATSCRRPDHKDLAHCTLHGYLFSLKRTNKRYYDGILDTGISAVDYRTRHEEVVTHNRAALRSYAAAHGSNQGSTPSGIQTQRSTTPSSHSSRQSNAWQRVETVRQSHLGSLPNPNAEQRGQVQFTSPVTVPSPAAVQFAPSETTNEPNVGDGLTETQWALALEAARQEFQQGTPRTSKRDKDTSTPGQKPRKSPSRPSSRKGRGHKKRGSHRKKGSSSSSSDSDFKSDSEPESDPSSSSESSAAKPPTFWYAVVLGLRGRYLVTTV